jgi:hypothetical protein
VPNAAVPINLKACITNPSRYEPGVNRRISPINHGFVVLPARCSPPARQG